MAIQDFDPVATFGSLIGSMMIAVKDRELPPGDERESEDDTIHGFHFECGTVRETLWIRDTELKRFKFQSPEDFDHRLTEAEGCKPMWNGTKLFAGGFFRPYRREITNG